MKLPPRDQMIIGRNALLEMLKRAPHKILRVWTHYSSSQDQRKDQILSICEEHDIPIENVSTTLLTQMAHSDSHQSFVAHIQGRRYFSVSDFLQEMQEKEKVFVLLVDAIFDPQNFGAILRSAECFGVDGVIWSKNRGCDLTPVVSKASAGASELLRLIRVSNLAEAVSELDDAGYEIVSAMPETTGQSFFDFQYSAKTVLIVGSEGEGIQKLLQKKTHRFITIPLLGKIESLNVAQATAILLSRRS